uniref:Uncharacterized protein n=1 Tax=Periophthalmus magnuspinnatus TaxID=409849 RepID=A0A3B4AL33_9GOBI
MMNKILLVCLLFNAGSSLTCKWMDRDFKLYSENSSLDQLNEMVNKYISSKGPDFEDVLSFPNKLYTRVSKAPAEKRLTFVAQLLDEIVVLFEENQTCASWHESAVDDFLNVMTQQLHGLRSCVASQSLKRKNKKLSMYFKKLSKWLKQKGHSTGAWEWVHKEVKLHLYRADLLVAFIAKKKH